MLGILFIQTISYVYPETLFYTIIFSIKFIMKRHGHTIGHRYFIKNKALRLSHKNVDVEEICDMHSKFIDLL